MIIKYNTKEKELLARIMRAEAIGEGNLGMLMVGNVVVNRVLANCHTFKDVTSLSESIYQKNQFSGTQSPLFFGNPTTAEINLAERILKGEYYHPATNALWFYSPGSGKYCRATWFNQRNSGRYKSHCFYSPDPGACDELY